MHSLQENPIVDNSLPLSFSLDVDIDDGTNLSFWKTGQAPRYVHCGRGNNRSPYIHTPLLAQLSFYSIAKLGKPFIAF